MLAFELPTAAKDNWRASMRLLLQRVYGRTYPYSVTSQVGGITVTGTVTRHVAPHVHKSKADTLIIPMTPAVEAALNNVDAMAELPTPHRERLLAYQAACGEVDDALVGEDAELPSQRLFVEDIDASWEDFRT